MSKYMTKLQFEEWVNKYSQEFYDKDNFVVYGFGDKSKRQRGIIIVNIDNGKVARSYCHPDDEYDCKIGIAVAYAHYMGVEIPKVEKSYWIEELVGKEVILPSEWSDIPTTVYVTPYKKEGGVVVVNRYTGCSLRVPPHLFILEHNIK